MKKVPHRALSVLSVIPLLLVGGVALTAPTDAPRSAEPLVTTADPGPASRYCPGPLQVPEDLLGTGGDEELAITPPSPAIGVRSLALESDSSLLFGEVSGAGTRYDEESGGVAAPSLTATTAEGEALDVDVASTDLGVSAQTISATEERVSLEMAQSDGTNPVGDALQYTMTTSGDFRSLAATRCAAPTSDAVFLGASTETGNSAALLLRNTSEQPATAAVQVWTEDGPAQMQGRSQVVVPAGEEEQILLESVVPGAQRLGVRVVTIGAPLAMTLQATERDGLAPGGAELQSPLPSPSSSLVIPGAHVVQGGSAVLDLLNPQGEDATAQVQLLGPDGAVDAPELEQVELPAGVVTRVALPTPVPDNYTVLVDADVPLSGVVRSTVVGGQTAGETAGAPHEFALAPPTQPLSGGSALAIPTLGARGRLLLQATASAEATVIPVGTDGTAGDPQTVELDPERLTVIDAARLTGTSTPVAGVTISPSVPGDVHASWVQRENDPASGPMVSIVPVQSPAAAAQPLSVTLR